MLARIRKALVAAFTAGLAAAWGLRNGTFTALEIGEILGLALAAGIATWAAPNKPAEAGVQMPAVVGRAPHDDSPERCPNRADVAPLDHRPEYVCGCLSLGDGPRGKEA